MSIIAPDSFLRPAPITPESDAPRRATTDDAARIARVFAAAFLHDPVFDWLTRPGPARAAALQRFFYWLTREHAVPHGETWTMQNGHAAIAWVPPYAEIRSSGLYDALRLLPALCGLTGFARLPRGRAMAAALSHAHPQEPFFYLAFIGVGPRFQGQSLGSGLLASTLARVDAAGTAAFLENSNPRNIPFYERFGFRVTQTIIAREDAPPLYAMWRPARRRGQGF